MNSTTQSSIPVPIGSAFQDCLPAQYEDDSLHGARSSGAVWTDAKGTPPLGDGRDARETGGVAVRSRPVPVRGLLHEARRGLGPRVTEPTQVDRGGVAAPPGRARAVRARATGAQHVDDADDVGVDDHKVARVDRGVPWREAGGKFGCGERRDDEGYPLHEPHPSGLTRAVAG